MCWNKEINNKIAQTCGTLRNNIAEQHCGTTLRKLLRQHVFSGDFWQKFFKKTRKVSLEKLIVSKASTSISGLAMKIRAKDLEQKRCEICKLAFRTKVVFSILNAKNSLGKYLWQSNISAPVI